MQTYRNPFHNGHLYLKIESGETIDFDRVLEQAGCPLQVGVLSDDDALIEQLTEAGFKLKRRTYELSVTSSEFVLPDNQEHNVELMSAVRGEPQYRVCAKLLYHHYERVHAAVNPLTAEFDDFIELLPERVVYSEYQNRMDTVAFVEENEIAYLAGVEPERIDAFIIKLVVTLFEKYTTIEYEADNTDWAANQFRVMFDREVLPTYDTYIKTE